MARAPSPDILSGNPSETPIGIPMTSLSVQELKASLGEVLDRVLRGEQITVLRHGKPVARLVPAVEPGLHYGSRWDCGEGIRPLGHRLSGGAYLDVLAEDRGGEDE
jgi:prevent-host-death family protein